MQFTLARSVTTAENTGIWREHAGKVKEKEVRTAAKQAEIKAKGKERMAEQKDFSKQAEAKEMEAKVDTQLDTKERAGNVSRSATKLGNAKRQRLAKFETRTWTSNAAQYGWLAR